jgi:hypothetical protein
MLSAVGCCRVSVPSRLPSGAGLRMNARVKEKPNKPDTRNGLGPRVIRGR